MEADLRTSLPLRTSKAAPPYFRDLVKIYVRQSRIMIKKDLAAGEAALGPGPAALSDWGL
jgi:hypothetical protein